MIGFIGLGKMGTGMVNNLLSAGHQVTVFARNRQSAHSTLKRGADWSDSVAALAASCDYIFTMVGGPEDVKSLYFGELGLLANAKKGSFLVDMTTSSSELALSIYKAGLQRSLHCLDAPVTGGVMGADAGSLTFMVGGDETSFELVNPLLQHMGKEIFHLGGAGAGQIAKSCNQTAVAGLVMGMSEALKLARTKGLPVEEICKILGTGTASSSLFKILAEKMLDGNDTASFTLSHFIKDLTIATDLATQNGEKLAAADCCLRFCQEFENSGDGHLGLQALLE